MPTLLDLERLLTRTTETADGCWEWQGARTGSGYGALLFNGRTELTHRIAYLCLTGPIPDGLVLDHLCRNTWCCNPEHLEAVTQGENVRRQPRISDRTSCPKGHELSGKNAYTKPSGGVACRRCRSEASARYYQRLEPGQPRKRARTACQRGHVLDDTNTYTTPSGSRNCRTCRAAAVKRYLARKRGEI